MHTYTDRPLAETDAAQRVPEQWEYDVEVSTPRVHSDLTDVTDFIRLRERGAVGWELVSVVAVPIPALPDPRTEIVIPFTHHVYYYFKRPKSAP